MIVCICHGVDSTQIRTLIAEGADSVAAIGNACGAGTGCGACRGQIQDFVDCGAEADTVSVAVCRRRLALVAERSPTTPPAP
jgi:bacterioferritin-associated ferredoxin